MTTPVDLWWVDLAAIDGPPDLLDAAERHRIARLRESGGDYRTFAASRIALRVLLGVYLGRDPATLQFEQPAAGKPNIEGAAGLRYSLSRSGSKTLIAIARDLDFGIDLERIRSLPELDSIARDILTPKAHDRFRRHRGSDRLDIFFSAWTAYEAVSKAEGRPLADARPIDWGTDGAAAAPTVMERRGRRWWLYPLALPGRYYGHLAAARAAEIRRFTFPAGGDTRTTRIAALLGESDIGVGGDAGDRQNRHMGTPR